MNESPGDKVNALIVKGVRIPCPGSVEIGEDVDPDRISGNNVTIYSGCKIYGESTFISDGVEMGYEAPATVENCFIGPCVKLKGGFFKEAVFLDGASMGSGAHVREGVILEEGASGAHTVGLKQTILLPFVTLGSLINFCDCLMAGGTDRKNHSEVGSSYIHFNYTPNQDKATASLIGDVPSGVMLNQKPVFLGGQGGLVGPCRLAFGTVAAAGSIIRKDELRPGRLIIESGVKSGNIPFVSGGYQGSRRIIMKNGVYIANLLALRQWYKHVRSLFVSDDFPEELLDGMISTLNTGVHERIKRLESFCENIDRSDAGRAGKISRHVRQAVYDAISDHMEHQGDIESKDCFLEAVRREIGVQGKRYISVVKGIDAERAAVGTKWLQSIVDRLSGAIAHVAD